MRSCFLQLLSPRARTVSCGTRDWGSWLAVPSDWPVSSSASWSLSSDKGQWRSRTASNWNCKSEIYICLKKIILFFQSKNQKKKKKLMLHQTTRALLSLSLQDLKKKRTKKISTAVFYIFRNASETSISRHFQKNLGYKDFGIYPTRTSLVACWYASVSYNWDPNKGFGEQYLWRKDSALRLYCRCIACLVNVFVLCNISTTAISFFKFPPSPTPNERKQSNKTNEKR